MQSLFTALAHCFRDTPHFQGLTLQKSVSLGTILLMTRDRYSPGVPSLYGPLPHHPKKDFALFTLLISYLLFITKHQLISRGCVWCDWHNLSYSCP